MPFTRNPRTSAPTPQAASPQAPAQNKPSYGLKNLFGGDSNALGRGVDKVGDWAATGVRLGSGFLPSSAMGLMPGAITGGAAEALAEFLESSIDPGSPGRIGVEAALGAVPLGKTLSAGRAVKSALKSGAFNAVGDLGRQAAEGNFMANDRSLDDLITGNKAPAPQGWDWKRTALAGGLGAAGGAFMGAKLHGTPAPKPAEDIIENMGGGVPKNPQAHVPAGTSVHSPVVESTPNYPSSGSNTIRGYEPRPGASSNPAPMPTSNGRLPYPGNAVSPEDDARFGQELADDLLKVAGPKQGRSKGSSPTSTPEPAQISGGQLSAGGPRGDLLENLTDPIAIKVYENHIKAGDTPRTAYKKAYQAQVFRESKNAPQTIDAVAEEVGEAAAPAASNVMDELVEQFPNSPNSTPKRLQFEDWETPPTGVREQLQNTTHPSFYDEGFDGLDMAKPSKGQSPKGSSVPSGAAAKLQAAEANYQPEAFEELKKASEIFNNPNSTREAKKAAGKSLAQIRDLMEGKGKYAPKDKGSSPDWVAEQSKAIDDIKIDSRPLDPSNHKGMAQTEALIHTALGLGGAATGAAIDASEGDDSAWDGALAGGMAGLAPALLRSVGLPDVDLHNMDDITKAAKVIANKIPNLQRFSLLANPSGLEQGMPALGMNAMVGPYGATVMHAIKGILMNDPRGLKLLKSVYNPIAFGKGMWDAKDEAWQAIAKGEGGRFDSAPMNAHSIADKAMAFPGVAMTAGDRYAQKLLQAAGYSVDEALRATLTSEPQALKGLSDSAKNSWLMQMMFPFRRTPLNVLEQGAQTTPGLGFLTGKDRGMKEMLVDQGIGTAAGFGSYALASNIDDDATRRNVKRATSNFGGRYSLPSTLGFLMGSESAKGNDPEDAFNARNIEQLFPLPTTEVISDSAKGAVNLGQFLIPGGDKGSINPTEILPDTMTLRSSRQWMADQFPQYAGSVGMQQPQRQRGFRRKLREQR